MRISEEALYFAPGLFGVALSLWKGDWLRIENHSRIQIAHRPQFAASSPMAWMKIHANSPLDFTHLQVEALKGGIAMKAHRTQRAMRTLILSSTLLAPSMALAQHERPDQWYLFGAVGGWRGVGGVQAGLGIGYERLFFKGLGAGAEFEGFGFKENGVLASANASYHFRNFGAGKVVPFGTLGVTLAGLCSQGCEGAGGYNWGGGINYWFKPNRGLRAEFRDHMLALDIDSHKWEVRLGFAF